MTITRSADFLEWSMADVLKAFLKGIQLREAHQSVVAKDEKQDKQERAMGMVVEDQRQLSLRGKETQRRSVHSACRNIHTKNVSQ